METALQVAERISNALYVILAVASLRQWLKHRDEASAWLAWTFASLGAVVAAGVVAGDDPAAAFTLVAVIVIAVFPYLLLRFSGAFDPLSARLHHVAALATGVMVAVSVAIGLTTGFPGPDEEQTVLSGLYTLGFVLQWTGILGAVTVRLWRAGSGQPTIARRRMRIMAGASLVITLALAVTAAGSEDAAVSLIGQGFGIASAVLFYLGFATPNTLRASWRSDAEDELYRAAVALMKVRQPSEVGDVMLPHLVSVLGAHGANLVVHATGSRASHGASEGDPTRVVELSHATVELWGSPYAPFFGDEEERLMGRLGLLADLAIDRARLLQSETAARKEVEAVNAELEAFVYTASHDLKTPLIAFLGYVDLLEMDGGTVLTDETRMYLERMRSNGVHMQALIDDLLALSRVGRVDTEPGDVDVVRLVRDIADDLGASYPTAHIEADDDVPAVRLNPTRARQLLTNAVANAVKHGGRADITIRVSGHRRGDGMVELRVRDDGVGIPEEHLERVTRVFERLTSDRSTGTGMGLAISRKICTEAGGDLWFEPSDQGADLRLLLPQARLRTRPSEGENEDVPSLTERPEGALQ